MAETVVHAAVILLVAPYAPRGTAASSPMARGPDGLIVPHGGGALVDTMVRDAKKQADLVASCNGVTLPLSDRNACDVELLTVGCVPVHNAGACETHAGWGQHACGQVRPPRLPSHSHPFANRAFSPLTGFMDEENYAHVVEHMRLKARRKLRSLCLSQRYILRAALTDATIITPTTWLCLFHPPCRAATCCLACPSCWTPTTSPCALARTCAPFASPNARCHSVAHPMATPIPTPQQVLLTYKGQQVAVLAISSKYKPNKPKEAKLCYGTSSIEHPGVSMIASERGAWYLGGTLHSLALPTRAFPCATPRQVRASLPQAEDVVAFQCRNPIHRAHWELIVRSLTAPNVSSGAVVLVHPTVGPTQDDDIPGPVRVHTYEVLKAETAHPRVRWAYMPYSMHMAGPREAIQHMMLRQNYGCTHFVIGRDMAGSKSSLSGEDWYGAYDAQDFAKQHAAELGMQTVPSLNVVYTQEGGYVTADVAKAQGYKELKLSGTKFRQMLRAGDDIPEWFAFKSVVNVLRSAAAQA